MEPGLLALIGVALAMLLPIIAAAIALVICGTAIAGVTIEKPDLFGRLMITVVLGEALAIYGLLIAFMLLSKLPDITTMEAGYTALIAGLIIGVAAVAAGSGISYCGSSLIGATAENPATYSSNIIAVVLSEALAIYGLLVAFMFIAQI